MSLPPCSGTADEKRSILVGDTTVYKQAVRTGGVLCAGLACLAAATLSRADLPTLSLTPRQIIRMDESAWMRYYRARSHRGGAQGNREALSVYSDSLDQCNQADLTRLSRRSPRKVRALLSQMAELDQRDLRGVDLRGPHGGSVAIGHLENKARLLHDLVRDMESGRRHRFGDASSLSKRAADLWRQTAPSTWSDAIKAQRVASIRREVAAWPLRARVVILAYLNAAR